MCIMKQLQLEEAAKPQHYSDCPGIGDPDCECNDECIRCGQWYPNTYVHTKNPEDDACVCSDCWEEAMSRD